VLHKLNISKNAEIKHSRFKSDSIWIDGGSKLIGVQITAKKIVIKSNASLRECKLFSDGIITIGENTVIKERALINAFKSITIGDRTIIDRDVFVGGMQSEKGQISVGNDCVILYRSYLNTTRKISIGNGVGIGGYCLIFTHSAWQNVLEGNPYKFADVVIKDNAWLPWNVTVLPGVMIDKGVSIGTGSVVTKSLPPYVFAAGVPAKIIRKRENGKLFEDGKNAIVLDVLSDFRGYALHYLGLKNVMSKTQYGFIISFENGRLVYTLDFSKNIQADDVIVSFIIPPNIKQKYGWIELDTLTSGSNKDFARHFIVFIKRYGIKIKSS
jgi:acetyltransferase-like isoleucine patch superfamily enzyme